MGPPQRVVARVGGIAPQRVVVAVGLGHVAERVGGRAPVVRRLRVRLGDADAAPRRRAIALVGDGPAPRSSTTEPVFHGLKRRSEWATLAVSPQAPRTHPRRCRGASRATRRPPPSDLHVDRLEGGDHARSAAEPSTSGRRRGARRASCPRREDLGLQLHGRPGSSARSSRRRSGIAGAGHDERSTSGGTAERSAGARGRSRPRSRRARCSWSTGDPPLGDHRLHGRAAISAPRRRNTLRNRSSLFSKNEYTDPTENSARSATSLSVVSWKPLAPNTSSAASSSWARLRSRCCRRRWLRRDGRSGAEVSAMIGLRYRERSFNRVEGPCQQSRSTPRHARPRVTGWAPPTCASSVTGSLAYVTVDRPEAAQRHDAGDVLRDPLRRRPRERRRRPRRAADHRRGDVFIPGGDLGGDNTDGWADLPRLLGMDNTPFDAMRRSPQAGRVRRERRGPGRRPDDRHAGRRRRRQRPGHASGRPSCSGASPTPTTPRSSRARSARPAPATC